MPRILFLNCSSGYCRLSYMLNDLKLGNVYELPSVGSVPVPSLAELVKAKGIDLVVTVVHTMIPDLDGCLGFNTKRALKQSDCVEPDCFGNWINGNVYHDDPFEHAKHTGEYIASLLPDVTQVLVVFDQMDLTMHPVASRQKGRWISVNMLWQNAWNTGFCDGIPDLPNALVPKSFRPLLERNRANSVLRLAAKSLCSEGHGGMKTLIFNATPYPVEAIARVRKVLGINGSAIYDVATVIYSPADLPGWWLPQMEGLFCDVTPQTDLILVASDQEQKMDRIEQCFDNLSERMRGEVLKYAQNINPRIRSLADITPEIAENLLSTDYFGWGGSLAYCIPDHGNKVRAALRLARDFEKTQAQQAKARRYEAASSFGLTIRGADPEDARDLVVQLGEALTANGKKRRKVVSDEDDYPF